MNKKIIFFLAIGLLVIGGILGFWYKAKDAEKEISEIKNHHSANQWNPYAKEDHYQATLSDQLISAGKGEYVVKMSVTLDFTSKDAYYKFKGYKDQKEAEKAAKKEEEHSSGEEGQVTPMELKINDIIGELMMEANEEQLTDRETLKGYLKDGINRKLGFDEPIVKEIYIENFIIQ